jgi:hypothetical protein
MGLAVRPGRDRIVPRLAEVKKSPDRVGYAPLRGRADWTKDSSCSLLGAFCYMYPIVFTLEITLREFSDLLRIIRFTAEHVDIHRVRLIGKVT